MESKRETNYWPAFVDALSNLVLTLVFVLLIFVISVFWFATKVSKVMAEQSSGEVVTVLKAKVEELQHAKDALAQHEDNLDVSRKRIAALEAALRKAQEQVKDSDRRSPGEKVVESVIERRVEIDVNDSEHKKTPATPSVSGGGELVVVSFKGSSIEMDAAVRERVTNALSLYRSDSTLTFELTASPGSESYSEGRRLAFFRLMTLRNVLLDNGIAQERVTTRIIKSGPSGKVAIRVARR